MSNFMYFFVAYVAIWVALGWYMITLSKRQKMLREEIRILKHRSRIQE